MIRCLHVLLAVFLLLPKAFYAADFFKNEENQPALSKEKQEVLNMLLGKVNALIRVEKLKFSTIDWHKLTCIGWPEGVKSKHTKDWDEEDLIILKSQMNEIIFKFPGGLPTKPLNDDPIRMLQGNFSNPTFDKFCERYKISNLLGSGSFGFVFKCERVGDSLACAVKCIYKPKLGLKHSLEHPVYSRIPFEVDLLSRIDHPNIIKLLDYYDDGVYGFMVTELFGASWDLLNTDLNVIRNPGLKTPCEASEAFGMVRSRELIDCIRFHKYLPEKTINYIFSQIYDAVCFLHSQGVYHADLKYENILVDADYRVKLIDFGLSRTVPRDSNNQEMRLAGFVGTELFLAPEVIKKETYLASEIETWALGVILYTMRTRRYAFHSREQILTGTPEMPLTDDTGVYDLIKRMLTREPSARIRLEEIKSHPWFLQFQKSAEMEVDAIALRA